jgi:hypothetical protein
MTASDPAEFWAARREWWRAESRRVGSDWAGIRRLAETIRHPDARRVALDLVELWRARAQGRAAA